MPPPSYFRIYLDLDLPLGRHWARALGEARQVPRYASELHALLSSCSITAFARRASKTGDRRPLACFVICQIPPENCPNSEVVWSQRGSRRGWAGVISRPIPHVHVRSSRCARPGKSRDQVNRVTPPRTVSSSIP